MNVLALRDASTHTADPAAALAGVLGISVTEARGRLHGAGPRVLAIHADRDQAERARAALSARGFAAFVLGMDEVQRDQAETVAAVAFELHEASFEVQTSGSGGIGIPYEAVRLVVRGLRIVQSTRTDTSNERVLSVGKALVTGGLAFTKKVQATTTRTEEDRALFARLFSFGRPPVDLPADELRYRGLGAAMQQTRAGNFAALLAELGRRAGHAAFDDQLATRGGQLQVLSERLPPERFLEVAVSLVARAHGAR
ncbi:MAG: hypothetical protein U0610_32985 [bacterium]